MIKICFTGHRPKKLCGYKKESYNDFVVNLTELLKKYITDDIMFITGGAQGFDQLAFWAVDNLMKENDTCYEIKNVVYVPFKGQENKWLQNGLFGKTEYKNMLRHASEIVYLNEHLTEQSAVIKALYERNHRMVNDSDYVIALYSDNTWSTTKGGTAECIRYAKSKNKQIIQIKYSIANNKLCIEETTVI